jgi:hypothetical protein
MVCMDIGVLKVYCNESELDTALTSKSVGTIYGNLMVSDIASGNNLVFRYLIAPSNGLLLFNNDHETS